MKTTQEHIEEWYKEYYFKKGKDRNDILANPGVLFQMFAFQKSVIEALRTLDLNKEEKILDVGCGFGGSLLSFIGFGFNPDCLYGIDIIPEKIDLGKKNLPSINFTSGDASQMNYSSDYFNIVMESTTFIQLIDDGLSQRIANEMLRVVKPNGYIILIDWRYGFKHDEYNALSRKRINTLFNVGTKTKINCCKNGALVPPIGRFLSSYFSSLYFITQRFFPLLVGQQVTILQKIE